jgi:competence protein ComEA
MKRRHLIPSLAALTLAFALPAIASAATNTASSAKSASAGAAKSATAAKTTAQRRHVMASHASAVKPRKIDINTATREELMALPGVDGPTADKIIEGRPYKNMGQLVSKNVVTKSEYGKIRSHVTTKTQAVHS